MSLEITPQGKLQHKRATSPLVNFKYAKVEIKNIDVNSRTISGYAAVFGNVDLAHDVIIKGAFAKSILDRGPGTTNGNKIAFCWQHDITEPLGTITVLKEDDYGLYFECVLDSFELAQRCLDQLKSGTLDQFSIGYSYVWDKMEYDSDLDAFICKELILMEISVVTLACNPLAQFEGMKSADRELTALKIQQDIEAVLKSLSFSKAYQLRKLFSESLALATAEPPEDKKALIKEQAAGQPIETPLDWGAIANIFN